MDDNAILEISYADLKSMLYEFQMDGLSADGCSCSLHLDEEEEVQYAIKAGTITVKTKKNS